MTDLEQFETLIRKSELIDNSEVIKDENGFSIQLFQRDNKIVVRFDADGSIC